MKNTTRIIKVSVGQKTYQDNQVNFDAALAALNSEAPELYQFAFSFRRNYRAPRTQCSETCFRRAFQDAWDRVEYDAYNSSLAA
jgi:hypothetical protein